MGQLPSLQKRGSKARAPRGLVKQTTKGKRRVGSLASPPPAGGGVRALSHIQVQQLEGLGQGLTSRYSRGQSWGRTSPPGTSWGRGSAGGLTSTYSSGNIPILSLSFPSAQLSSTLLITVKTSSWKWPMETSPGTCTKTDTETEPRDQSVSLMLRKDSK